MRYFVLFWALAIHPTLHASDLSPQCTEFIKNLVSRDFSPPNEFYERSLLPSAILKLRASALPEGADSIPAIAAINAEVKARVLYRLGEEPSAHNPGPEPIKPVITKWQRIFGTAREIEVQYDLDLRKHRDKTKEYDKSLRKQKEWNTDRERIQSLASSLGIEQLPHPVMFARDRDSLALAATMKQLHPSHPFPSIPDKVKEEAKPVIERLAYRESLGDASVQEWKRAVTAAAMPEHFFPASSNLYPKNWQRPAWQYDFLIEQGIVAKSYTTLNRGKLEEPKLAKWPEGVVAKLRDPDVQALLKILLAPENQTEQMHSPVYLDPILVTQPIVKMTTAHALDAIHRLAATPEQANAAFYIASWGIFSEAFHNKDSVGGPSIHEELNRTLQLSHFDVHKAQIAPPIDHKTLTVTRFLELAQDPKVQELSEAFQAPLQKLVYQPELPTVSEHQAPKPVTASASAKSETAQAPKAEVTPYSDAEVRALRQRALKLLPTFTPEPDLKVGSSTVQAGQHLSSLVGDLNKRFLERKPLIEVIARAVIGKNHVLMVGPGGTGKTSVSKAFMNSLVDDEGKPSFFWHQMTDGTTLNDLFGPLDPSALSRGQYSRLTNGGTLHRRNAFYDEFFNPSKRIVQYVLGLMEEGEAYIDGQTVKGDTEVFLAATNKYSSQLYTEYQNDDLTPNRDRFTYHQYVGPEMEDLSSIQAIVSNNRDKFLPKQPLRFSEVDELRQLNRSIQIPSDVMAASAYLFEQMKVKTAEEAFAAVRAMEEKQPRLAPWGPRYYPTRLYGPRSLVAMPSALRAGVTRNWTTSPTGNLPALKIEDLQVLEPFFAMSGARTDQVEAERARSLNPDQVAQLDTILIERRLFENEFTTLKAGVAAVPELQRVKQIANRVSDPGVSADTLARDLEFLLAVAEAEPKILAQSKTASITPATVGQLQAAREAKPIIRALAERLEGK